MPGLLRRLQIRSLGSIPGFLLHTQMKYVWHYTEPARDSSEINHCLLLMSFCKSRFNPYSTLFEISCFVTTSSVLYLTIEHRYYRKKNDRRSNNKTLYLVFRIRRILMFLGLLDPDPLVRGTNPDLALEPIIEQK
jgi:hypothetical protein